MSVETPRHSVNKKKLLRVSVETPRHSVNKKKILRVSVENPRQGVRADPSSGCHVLGSTPTGDFEGGSCPSTHSTLGFPFHFSLFVASSLNIWGGWHVWSDCHLSRQSSGGHGWLLPPPLSSWRLRLTVKAALSSWMVVAPCLTVKPHPDWSMVTDTFQAHCQFILASKLSHQDSL